MSYEDIQEQKRSRKWTIDPLATMKPAEQFSLIFGQSFESYRMYVPESYNVMHKALDDLAAAHNLGTLTYAEYEIGRRAIDFLCVNTLPAIEKGGWASVYLAQEAKLVSDRAKKVDSERKTVAQWIIEEQKRRKQEESATPEVEEVFTGWWKSKGKATDFTLSMFFVGDCGLVDRLVDWLSQNGIYYTRTLDQDHGEAIKTRLDATFPREMYTWVESRLRMIHDHYQAEKEAHESL